MARTRPSDELNQQLRRLPSVEELASLIEDQPRPLAVRAAREEIVAERERLLATDHDQPEVDGAAGLAELRARAAKRAAELATPSLRRVVNATGVVLHTNLGRAPLHPWAQATVAEVALGYSNLELDLDSGQRGSRQAHVASLLTELSGAEAALAVNNNAGAVLLMLAAHCADGEVIVGRSQLVEIGDSFRIPEILEVSGARLVEVGTTNRTRIEDYEAAISDQTRAILRVHQSNFRTIGFVDEAELAELRQLAAESDVLLLDDLGSGAIEPIADEPTLTASLDAGCDLIACSADKLFGGPQAGLIFGAADAVAACRSHPLARALRLDKLQLAALGGTLRVREQLGASAIPALAMIGATEEELLARAERLQLAIGDGAVIERAQAAAGGGSLPLHELEGPICALRQAGRDACRPDQLARRLRGGDPPIIVRIAGDAVILDPRTIADDDIEIVAGAVRSAVV